MKTVEKTVIRGLSIATLSPPTLLRILPHTMPEQGQAFS